MDVNRVALVVGRRLSVVGGFTLIEMMISIGIFVMISTIVLANYNGFNTRILLTNLAYDVALTVRQAQVYGISTRDFDSTDADYTSSGRAFGVYFQEADNGGTGPSFLLIDDRNANNKYNNIADTANETGTLACLAGTELECLEKYTIKRGNKINKFCVLSGATSVCSNSVVGANLDKLLISFKRPNPDAIFSPVFDSGSLSNIDQAQIEVVSPQGVSKTVSVRLTGQISVF